MKLKIMLMAVAVTLTSCASDGGGGQPGARAAAAGKVQACRAGDTMVASSSQCLSDDAACYELANGSWCTGERGNTCPTGSSPIPQGSACPRGAHCFAYNSSLTCAIL